LTDEDRREIEDQFDRYKPELLKLLKETKPEDLRDVGYRLASLQSIVALALYDSSKKVERYSKVLACLTIVLVFLTCAVAYLDYLTSLALKR
jgi:hypothetical protein